MVRFLVLPPPVPGLDLIICLSVHFSVGRAWFAIVTGVTMCQCPLPFPLLFCFHFSIPVFLSPSSVVFLLSSSFGVLPPFLPFHSCSSLFSSSCSPCPFVLFVCFPVFFPFPPPQHFPTFLLSFLLFFPFRSSSFDFFFLPPHSSLSVHLYFSFLLWFSSFSPSFSVVNCFLSFFLFRDYVLSPSFSFSSSSFLSLFLLLFLLSFRFLLLLRGFISLPPPPLVSPALSTSSSSSYSSSLILFFSSFPPPSAFSSFPPPFFLLLLPFVYAFLSASGLFPFFCFFSVFASFFACSLFFHSLPFVSVLVLAAWEGWFSFVYSSVSIRLPLGLPLLISLPFLCALRWGFFPVSSSISSISRTLPLVQVPRMPHFLLLGFPSAFVLFASVLRILFFAFASFLCPLLRFLSPVCGCFPFIFASLPESC